jgi:hypothetical protein
MVQVPSRASRRSRPKPAPVAPPKPAPIVTTRIGLGNVNQSVNQQITRPLAIEPLTAPLASATARPVASTASRPVDLGAPPITPGSLAASLVDPRRLREALVLNEILQPPLALRGRMGRAR